MENERELTEETHNFLSRSAPTTTTLNNLYTSLLSTFELLLQTFIFCIHIATKKHTIFIFNMLLKIYFLTFS